MKILGHCFERQHLAAQNDDISMILDGFNCSSIPISAVAANLEPYIGIVFDHIIWAVSSCKPVGWWISIGWSCVFLYIAVLKPRDISLCFSAVWHQVCWHSWRFAGLQGAGSRDSAIWWSSSQVNCCTKRTTCVRFKCHCNKKSQLGNNIAIAQFPVIVKGSRGSRRFGALSVAQDQQCIWNCTQRLFDSEQSGLLMFHPRKWCHVKVYLILG